MTHDLIDHLASALLRGALLLPALVLIAIRLRRGSAAFLRRFWRFTFLAVLGATVLSFAPPLVKLRSTAAAFSRPAGLVAADTIPTRAPNVPGSPVTSLEHVMGLPLQAAAPTPAPAGTPTASAPTRPTLRLSLPVVLALLWLGGVLLLAVRKLAGTIGAHRLRRSATAINDDAWFQDLDLLRASCGVSRVVQLRQHLALRSPIVTGIRRPIIILPADHAAYSPDDRRAVLLHELAHVRHHDARFRWIAAIASILHWPNPMIWFAERSMRLAEERASDDAVLNGGIAAPAYAELLARLAKGGAPLVGDLGVAGGTAMAQPSGLLPRVNAILCSRQARRQPGRLASLTVAGSSLALAILTGSSALVGADPETTTPSASNPPGDPVSSFNPIDQKLSSIVFPLVDFHETSLRDALDFIRQKSVELDDGPAETRGLNIIAKFPRVEPAVEEQTPQNLLHPITLRLEQVPLRALLDFVCKQTRLSYRVSDFAVLIAPRVDGDYQGLVSRNFRIPAEVLNPLVERHAPPLPPNDPFGDEPEVSPQITARSWLESAGVEFSPQCSAFFIKEAGTLNVRNTPFELEFIERIVGSLTGGPVPGGRTATEAARLAHVKDALQHIIIPIIEFDEVSLPDALDYLRVKAAELDPSSDFPNPAQFIVNVAGENLQPITLTLRNVPLGIALKHVASLATAGGQTIVGPYAIEINDHFSSNGSLQLATYQLTPENMKRIQDSIPGFELAKYTPGRVLSTAGVEFPRGTGAFWNPNTGELIVRQTIGNLNEIETLLQGLEPPTPSPTTP